MNLPLDMEFVYLPPENGFNLKNEFLWPELFFSTQNFSPVNFSDFQVEKVCIAFKLSQS